MSLCSLVNISMPQQMLRKINIEVPLALLTFASTISGAVKSNLIIFRACYVTLGYPEEECALLGSQNPSNQTAGLEAEVEPYAAVITMASTLTEGFCAAIVCLFAGPWSDRFGRKPLLIIPVIGYLLFYLLTTLFAVLENVSPWYSLICLVPVCLTGGSTSYYTGVFCYVTDCTSDANRGMRMGIVEGVLFLAIFSGMASSSYLFAATSYATVFMLAATCCLLALFFTSYFIPESRESESAQLQKLFQISNVSDMVKITFKKRPNYARFTILSCIVITILASISGSGLQSVIFFFLRDKFHWSLQKFTLFAAGTIITRILGAVIGVYFLHKLLKIPETLLMVVSLLSGFSGVVLLGLAQTDQTLYGVPAAQLLESIFNPMVQSLVSKVVPTDELGKIFAFGSASQALLGLAGSPLYTFIYNGTISTNPGFFSFVSAGILLIGILVAIGVCVARSVLSRPEDYQIIINEESEEDPVVT